MPHLHQAMRHSLKSIVTVALVEFRIGVVWLDPGADYRQSHSGAGVVVIPRELDDEACALAALQEIGRVVLPCPGYPRHRAVVETFHRAGAGARRDDHDEARQAAMP